MKYKLELIMINAGVDDDDDVYGDDGYDVSFFNKVLLVMHLLLQLSIHV